MFFNQQKILSAAKGREIIFWGCSEDWIPKSKKLLPEVNVAVDILHSKIDDVWMDLTVLSPEHLNNKSELYYVVITTGSVASVEEQLSLYGFKPETDFCYSPVFEDFASSAKLSQYETNLLFTSSDYGTSENNRGSLLGGGIYNLQILKHSIEINRLVKGSYRQAQFKNGQLYTVDYVKNELHIFSLSLELINSIELNLRHYTGLSVSDEHIFLVSSSHDVIQVYDIKSHLLVDTIVFSAKSNSGEGAHHLNDCFFYENKLFFSYFSKSGIWRNEVFDGGISFYDLETKEISEVKSNLFQPHSPKIINDTLHFCESPKGAVYSSSWNKIAELPGFVRGVCYEDGYYFIGQSETLYMKRALDIKNVMMNAGIYILDETTNAVRFCAVNGLKNIHSVLSYPKHIEHSVGK